MPPFEGGPGHQRISLSLNRNGEGLPPVAWAVAGVPDSPVVALN